MTTPDNDPTWSEQEIDEQRNRIPSYVEPIPGIDPGISQAPDAFEEQHQALFGTMWRAAVVAGTAAAMVHAATGLLGMGEYPAGSNHNPVTEEYNREIAHIGDGPWCDMGVTVEAIHSGNLDAVCGGPHRGFAYTIAHAQDFKRRGLWTYGLHGVRPGDVVFFSWRRGSTIGSIEHVGVVEHVHDNGDAVTIECNIGNACRREVRDSTYVVGYGRPPYHAQRQEEEMPEYVHLRNEHLEIPAKGEVLIHWPIEYVDTAGHHANTKHGTSYPSLMTGAKHGTRFAVSISTKDGAPVKWRLRETNPDKHYTSHKTYNPQDHLGWCDAGKHLWVYAIGDGTAKTVDIEVKAEYFEYK